MTFLLPAEAARGDCVRESEKYAFVSTRFVESLKKQIELVLQHRLKALTTDVTLTRAVNCIANGHVVSGNGLRNRTCGDCRSDKQTLDLLSRAYFGKCAVYSS